jgi:adenylylsulfate kinase-like enzyme
MYAKARRGEMKDFTGVDAPYEAPLTPEIRVDASLGEPAETLAILLRTLGEH